MLEFVICGEGEEEKTKDDGVLEYISRKISDKTNNEKNMVMLK